MILFWRIRYLDRRDRHFYDRDLWLDTHSLPPKQRAEVEAIYEARESLPDTAILKLRHLFIERCEGEADLGTRVKESVVFGNVSLPHYFEFNTEYILQRSFQNQIQIKTPVSFNCLQDIKSCLKNFKDDIAEEHWNIMFKRKRGKKKS